MKYLIGLFIRKLKSLVSYGTLNFDDKFNRENDIDISAFTIDISKNPDHLFFMGEIPEKLQIIVIELDRDNIRYIKNPTIAVQAKAIKYAGLNLKYIENPTREIQIKAIKADGDAIQYVENPDEELQLKAIKENCFAISHIKNPTYNVQRKAIKTSFAVIKYIKNIDQQLVKEFGNRKVR